MSSIIVSKLLIFLICNLSLLPVGNFSFVNNFDLNNFDINNNSKIIESQLLKNYLQKRNQTKLEVNSNKYIVLDVKNDIVLYEKDSLEVQPIASITKLMTALVALDLNPDWNKSYKITREDRREGGRIYLYLGDEVSIKDLFELSLVGSANTATFALVNSLNFSKDEYVNLMNIKAKELGMKNTFFSDVTGLSINNKSNAKDISILVREALSREEIQSVVEKSVLTIETKKGREVEVESTDKLLDKDLGIKYLKGGKTGYLPEAGYCFAAKFEKDNEELITVVLGADGKNDRFDDTIKLVSWSYNLNLEY
ncbi:D-alanyl-D-alanine carboxypeptidase [bacterium]|nr:D-alanyl-D-alanine carboxypeptidase [bacterium]